MGCFFLHCVCDPCLIHVWWLKWTNCSSLMFSPVWICVKIVLPKIVHWFIIIMFSIKVAIWAVYPILRDTLPQYSWLDHVRSKNCLIPILSHINIPLFCHGCVLLKIGLIPGLSAERFLISSNGTKAKEASAELHAAEIGGEEATQWLRGHVISVSSLALWKLTLLSYTAYYILTHLCLEHMVVLIEKMWW